MTMNGYNFTERVRKVLAQARVEAAALHHEYVGTEHILLAIAREGDGVASAVLDNLSVSTADIITRVLGILVPGKQDQRIGPDLPYTSRAKKILELSMSEARSFSHSYVGTEHLLLGVLAEEKGVGAQILQSVGVTLDKARAETLRLLGTPNKHPSNAEPTAAPAAAPGYARSRSPYGVAIVEDFS